ncbi:MAG: tRNA (adenosine(37)-N6)-threonylcarbamoyltransferase complex ATPase subunit type 1 TsaE [Candidatus Saccharimonadales bacterium]
MSTARTSQIVATSADDTAHLAASIGAQLRGGEVIELVSDLGGGKTTFVRSLARGMGSTDKVGSPTFTISREYKAGDLTLYHFDFYRLGEAGIMSEELIEIINDQKAVVVIEWAGIVENMLPADRLMIHITATGETERVFDITYPETLAYLVESNT